MLSAAIDPGPAVNRPGYGTVTEYLQRHAVLVRPACTLGLPTRTFHNAHVYRYGEVQKPPSWIFNVLSHAPRCDIPPRLASFSHPHLIILLYCRLFHKPLGTKPGFTRVLDDTLTFTWVVASKYTVHYELQPASIGSWLVLTHGFQRASAHPRPDTLRLYWCCRAFIVYSPAEYCSITTFNS